MTRGEDLDAPSVSKIQEGSRRGMQGLCGEHIFQPVWALSKQHDIATLYSRVKSHDIKSMNVNAINENNCWSYVMVNKQNYILMSMSMSAITAYACCHTYSGFSENNCVTI